MACETRGYKIRFSPGTGTRCTLFSRRVISQGEPDLRMLSVFCPVQTGNCWENNFHQLEKKRTKHAPPANLFLVFCVIAFSICSIPYIPSQQSPSPAIHSLPSALLPVSLSKQVSSNPTPPTYSTCVWILCLQNINTAQNVTQPLTYSLQN